MNKDKTMKLIGLACTLIGFGITIIKDKIEDDKLETIVAKEVKKQLEQSKEQ